MGSRKAIFHTPIGGVRMVHFHRIEEGDIFRVLKSYHDLCAEYDLDEPMEAIRRSVDEDNQYLEDGAYFICTSVNPRKWYMSVEEYDKWKRQN